VVAWDPLVRLGEWEEVACRVRLWEEEDRPIRVRRPLAQMVWDPLARPGEWVVLQVGWAEVEWAVVEWAVVEWAVVAADRRLPASLRIQAVVPWALHLPWAVLWAQAQAQALRRTPEDPQGKGAREDQAA